MLSFEHCRRKEDWAELANEFCRKARPLDELVEALFSQSPKQRRQQYAGYVLLHVHRTCPDTLIPLLDKLAFLLSEEHDEVLHHSIYRQVFSVFQDRLIPEHLAGRIYSIAVEVYTDLGQPIAARARALDCATNVAEQYDGLWAEIAELAALLNPTDSPGMHSMCRRVAKKAARALAKH